MAQPLGRLAAGAGLVVASKWFLDHGYMVSIPLEVAPYDLVAESDEGLQRVQVKTTSARPSGRFHVQISRLLYDPTATLCARGKVRRISSNEADIDYFFILTGAGTRYLLPIRVVAGQLTLTLDEKYANFVVE